MYRLLKHIMGIHRELKRIREILEIAHAEELIRAEISRSYVEEFARDSDREFVVAEPEVDDYGEPIRRDKDE